jgi:hypothetical protein
MLLTAMLSTKLAVVVTSAVVAAGGLTGVGFAANDAAPGDVLYGLDCAMESVGLGDGGAQERIHEATELVERGEVEQGLNHAAQAAQSQVGLDENGQAMGALTAASNAVRNGTHAANQGEASQIQARVAEMLQWMSATMADGGGSQSQEFGQGVTERAREITGEADQLRLRTQDQTQTQTQTQTETQDQTQTQSQDHVQEQSGAAYQEQNGEANQSQNGQGSRGGK